MSDAVNDMQPITPLGGTSPRTDAHGPLTLLEVTDTALASYASRLGQESAAQKALGDFVGLTALPNAGSAVVNAPFSVIWMGPDQWMVMAPHDSHEDLAARLSASSNGSASITEQNDAWCRFDLKGTGLAAVFELLCPINLRACTGGEATRTSIDHLGCLVFVQTPEHVTVLGPRSSAGSLHHALLTAMHSAH